MHSSTIAGCLLQALKFSNCSVVWLRLAQIDVVVDRIYPAMHFVFCFCNEMKRSPLRRDRERVVMRSPRVRCHPAGLASTRAARAHSQNGAA
jgi:hypothetical protein